MYDSQNETIHCGISSKSPEGTTEAKGYGVSTARSETVTEVKRCNVHCINHVHHHLGCQFGFKKEIIPLHY